MINRVNLGSIQETYTIHRPKIEEALELATMHNKSWVDTYPNDDAGVSLEYIKELISTRLSEESLDRRRSNIARSKDDTAYFLRIAKNKSGDIVGFIDGFFENDTYELAGLYTDKKTHGSGLAMQLWHSYKQWMNPAKTVWLTVATYNEKAKAFYRKVGFKELPHTKRLYKKTRIPVIDMERIPEKI